ncbi:hypothetical protein [Burkholderia lata]|uniref:hypothetical protein n=1 Tax=Burkholderia lata (strain ATCC 17760 / DSM 23089 / LMG 22485 / NCIMB 9086 / R18194 / 383) TaxID=482957 RepID=UPI001C2EFFE2|nr:hypothetical protein [Burkholderia lata]
MVFLWLIVLGDGRKPFAGEVALQGGDGKGPALADLAAGQRAGARLQAHRFGMRAEQGRGAGQVDGCRGRGRVAAMAHAGRARSATRGVVDRV